MTLDDADQRREAIHDFIQRQGPGLDIGDHPCEQGCVTASVPLTLTEAQWRPATVITSRRCNPCPSNAPSPS